MRKAKEEWIGQKCSKQKLSFPQYEPVKSVGKMLFITRT